MFWGKLVKNTVFSLLVVRDSIFTGTGVTPVFPPHKPPFLFHIFIYNQLDHCCYFLTEAYLQLHARMEFYTALLLNSFVLPFDTGRNIFHVQPAPQVKVKKPLFEVPQTWTLAVCAGTHVYMYEPA